MCERERELCTISMLVVHCVTTVWLLSDPVPTIVSKAQFTDKYEGNVRLMSGDSAKDSYQGVLHRHSPIHVTRLIDYHNT